MNKFLLYTFSFAILAACSGGNTDGTQQQENGDRVPVEVSELKPETFRHYVQVQGEVESDRTIPVVPKASAEVERVLVSRGQDVQKGQVIARLDASAIKAQEKELQTRLELAETLYERQKNLREEDIGSEIQFLEAKNNWESLKAQLATLREQLDNYTIKAPIKGYLEQIDIKEGEFVDAGRQIAMLSNREALSVKAPVSEAYYSTVERGDTVDIMFPSMSKTIRTTIHNVGQSLDPSNRTFETVILLNEDNNDLAPNMISKVRINDQTITNTIAISMNVVLRDREYPYVYLAKKEAGEWKAKPQQVELGPAYNDQVVIKSGLKSGDRLIVDGYQGVREDETLQIVD